MKVRGSPNKKGLTMRVLCNAKKARMSPKERPMAAFETESEFDLTISKEYTVFATAIWDTMILLLLADDYGLPNWHPVEIFSLTENRLPDDWFFSTTVANEHGVQAILGYKRLIEDPTHYEALLERDQSALNIFNQERARKETADA
jgi:hypothetical protein